MARYFIKFVYINNDLLISTKPYQSLTNSIRKEENYLTQIRGFNILFSMQLKL